VEKIHLGEEVPIKLILLTPFFLTIFPQFPYLSLTFPFGAVRTVFREEENQKSKSGGGKKFDKIERYLPKLNFICQWGSLS